MSNNLISSLFGNAYPAVIASTTHNGRKPSLETLLELRNRSIATVGG